MSRARNLAQFGNRTLLSARLTATGTELVINGLEADTIYRGNLLCLPVLDTSIAWQSRFVSGGSWDAGGSDYAVQSDSGTAGTAVASTTLDTSATMGSQDGGNLSISPFYAFSLYSGSPTARAELIFTGGYISTDGASTIVTNRYSRRQVSGAIADLRFFGVTANSLASGSRAFLEKLG